MTERDDRRNHYSISTEASLRETMGREQTMGESLELPVDTRARGRATKK